MPGTRPLNVGGSRKNRAPQGTTAGATRWQNSDRRDSWEATGPGYLFPAVTSLSREATGNSCGTQPPSVLGGHWPELGERCCIYIGLISPAALHPLCFRAPLLPHTGRKAVSPGPPSRCDGLMVLPHPF
ncbi:unnamed protein product [Rangifer tarandus platyrhynchus]|uniref:Uncharacterized protein n=1 Tax=Rangifer tarandus platyrhynchus TaxID=3082113 RepID=A0AC59ZMJ9_RANTA